MKNNTIRFFEDKGIKISSLVTKGVVKGLTEGQVEKACEIVYFQYLEKEKESAGKISYITLARDVWSEAAGLKSKAYLVTRNIVSNQQEQINRLTTLAGISSSTTIILAVVFLLFYLGIL